VNRFQVFAENIAKPFLENKRAVLMVLAVAFPFAGWKVVDLWPAAEVKAKAAHTHPFPEHTHNDLRALILKNKREIKELKVLH